MIQLINNKVFDDEIELGELSVINVVDDTLCFVDKYGVQRFIPDNNWGDGAIEVVNAWKLIYPNGIPIIKETLEDGKKRLIAYVSAYRFSKQEWFTYDGHTQRRQPYDEIRMDAMIDYLQQGKISQVEWAFSDTDSKIVSDPQYFQNMKDTGYIWEMTLRGVEKSVKQQIEHATTLDGINVEAMFDQILSSLG